MSLLTGGGTPILQSARTLLPEELWSELDKNSVPILSEDSLYKIAFDKRSFIDFLTREANRDSAVSFEIDSVMMPQSIFFFIKIYLKSCQVKTFRFALPLGTRKPDENTLLLTSCGATAISWSSSPKAAIFYATQDFASEVLNRFFGSEVQLKSSLSGVTAEIPGLADYRMTFGYRL